MKALILAAGKSTRLHPLTLTKPKPLIKIAGKTILEHNLEQLKGIITEVIIIVGYKKEMIKKALGNEFLGIKITYVEQKEQLGTGHAVMSGKKHVDDKFIVLNGDDIYSSKDIKSCVKNYPCVLGKEVVDASKWGILISKGKKLVEIKEKPKNLKKGVANTGLFVVDKKIFDIKIEKSSRGEYEFTDMISKYAKEKNVKIRVVKDYWLPIGYPWHILDANEVLLSKLNNKIEGKVGKNVHVNGKLTLGKSSKILFGTYIEGNVVIGKNCKIGPNAYIRGSTSIGDNCHIGANTEIKNGVIGNRSNVPHLIYIGDTVIGDSCNLGAGTIVANLKHDKSNVKTMINGKLVDTGRHKFGAVIADGVKTGINTSIYPGRKLWPNTGTLPGEIVAKDKEK
ncbi:NTP transferase domain-containing protein [Candidatus Woesearchaeota archaeon]|nr:NTP transferase domain-containing protein [Candidatus Woesearchaeota archaeon]